MVGGGWYRSRRCRVRRKMAPSSVSRGRPAAAGCGGWPRGIWSRKMTRPRPAAASGSPAAAPRRRRWPGRCPPGGTAPPEPGTPGPGNTPRRLMRRYRRRNGLPLLQELVRVHKGQVQALAHSRPTVLLPLPGRLHKNQVPHDCCSRLRYQRLIQALHLRPVLRGQVAPAAQHLGLPLRVPHRETVEAAL